MLDFIFSKNCKKLFTHNSALGLHCTTNNPQALGYSFTTANPRTPSTPLKAPTHLYALTCPCTPQHAPTYPSMLLHTPARPYMPLNAPNTPLHTRPHTPPCNLFLVLWIFFGLMTLPQLIMNPLVDISICNFVSSKHCNLGEESINRH